MKKILAVSMLLLSFIVAFALEGEKNVAAGIDHVTLFYSGAQIERSSKSIALEKGQTVLTLEGLERNLVENSIRVGLTGDGKIMSVVKRMEYLQQGDANLKIGELEKKLKSIENEKEEVFLVSRVYDQEKTMLMSNIKLGSEQQGVQIAELKEAADFYRTRLEQIETKLLMNNRKVKDLEAEIDKIIKQLSDLNYQKNRPSSTIELTVEMPSAGSVRILMDYYIPNARWIPQYDIRVDEIGKPVSVIRKASAAQSTGVDWKDIKITFSTGNPQDRASKPNLHPWYLRQYYPEPTMQIRGAATMAPSSVQSKSTLSETVVMEDEVDMGIAMAGAMPGVEMGSNNSLLEFKLSSSASIPSDNKEYAILIGSMEMEASYEYHTVPKLDPSAYLMALVDDWESYDLISGSANIYYEGMFVGKTFIDASSTLDIMQISLGKDKGIQVERKQVNEYSSDRIIGANRKKDFGYENIIRNSKKETVTVIVEDQYPVSTLKDIEVIQEDHGDAVLEEASGKVTWKQLIPAGETVKLPFRYSVKYPSGMQINL